MGRTRVGVIYGGRSTEHGISVVSAAGVMGAIDTDEYEIVPLGITREGGWVLTDADPALMTITERHVPEVGSGARVVQPADPAAAALIPMDDVAGQRPSLGSLDVVFPVLHGRYGEDGTIQGLFEMAGIPYVGSGVFASAAAMDKEYTKKLLRAEGLDVGDFAVVRRGQRVSAADFEHFGLPVFVKPARAGSSVGITKVTDWDELPAALDRAFDHDDKVLVEAAVVGHEVECGVLEADPAAGGDGLPEASMPAEIRMVRGHDWYDFEAKYLDDACEFDIPAELAPEQIEVVRAAACRAFTALDCAGLARVDFFVTDATAGRPIRVIVNEVNTMPGFTPISLFPQMWAASGLDYRALVDRLIRTAIRRGPR